MAEKISRYVIACLQILFIGVAVYELWQSDYRGFFVVLQAIAVSFIPYVLTRITDIYVPVLFRVGIALFMFLTLVLGEIAGFYDSFWWWDALLHAVASAGLTLIGFICIIIFFKQSDLQTVPLFATLLAISFALFCAVLWEVYEFLVDSFVTDAHMQPSNADTMSDLIISIVFALIAGFGGYRYVRWRSGGLVGDIIKDGVQNNKNI